MLLPAYHGVVKPCFLPPADTPLSVLSGTTCMESVSTLCAMPGFRCARDFPGKAFHCFRSALWIIQKARSFFPHTPLAARSVFLTSPSPFLRAVVAHERRCGMCSNCITPWEDKKHNFGAGPASAAQSPLLPTVTSQQDIADDDCFRQRDRDAL